MDNGAVRWGAILLIAGTLAVGLWTRRHPPDRDDSQFTEDVMPRFEHSEARATGAFEEPLTGMAGFEVSLPGCVQSFGVLPVPASDLSIAPTAFSYRDGNYGVFYVYNAKIYREPGIGVRLKALTIIDRLIQRFRPSQTRPGAFYLKLWAPAGCGLRAPDIVALDQGFRAYPRAAPRS